MLTSVPPPACAVMSTRLRHAAHQRQPEPEAGTVVPRRHSGALVGHRQQQRVAVAARLEVDLAAGLPAVGVDDAVGDDLGDREQDVGQRSRIDADRRAGSP